jgi:hypothetical protein
VRRFARALARRLYRGRDEAFVFQASNKVGQILLTLQYQELVRRGCPLPSFDQVEFRAFSQNGEDGILLYLFALVGTTGKRCVELCCGDGIECNTANLILNHGWTGLLVDGRADRIRRGRSFYARCRDTDVWPPDLVQAWVTAEDVNGFLTARGYTGELDLLSLDMDGVDYWIWKAIECVSPRVVVLEYNNILGPEPSLTVPYSPSFRAPLEGSDINYFGASLRAYCRLAREKGYRLVGCERYGFNAFFVRDDVGSGVLPEVPLESCFGHPYTRHAMRERSAALRRRAWVEV